MITFEIRWLETDKWQLKDRNGWSEPMPKSRLDKLLRTHTKEPSTVDPIKDWGKPLAPATKRVKTMDEQAKDLYEIRGGKVQRIAATAAERQAQQVADILAALELE